MPRTACSLHCLHSDIKEVANVCNQSLMKLVIPEDDEMDEAKQATAPPAEPASEEPVPEPEAASGGESVFTWAVRGVVRVFRISARVDLVLWGRELHFL